MFYTLIEIPVVALWLMTGEKSRRLRRLIKKLNSLRKRVLDEYAEEEWVWEGYDPEQNPYSYLEKHITMCNVTTIGFLVVFYILVCILVNPAFYLN